MTSKSSDFSTASSYAFISDDNGASPFCSKVEGLTEDLASPSFRREIVCHPGNSSLLDQNFQEEAEFSMGVDIEQEDAPRDVPRGNSIFHSLYTKNKLVFISFDLETGGEGCGIIQMSAQIFRIKNNEAEVEVNVFNEYVNPGREAVWNDQACMASHDLSPENEKIVNADTIDLVWTSFEDFLDANIESDQVGVLIAWNEEGCALRWLYKVAQAPYSSLNFPCKVKYFLDPLAVLRTHSRCKLHKKHSKLESYSLGSVYEYITRNVLDGVRNSLVNVKAQTLIVKDSRFVPFINCTQSIRTIDELFQRREQRENFPKSEPSMIKQEQRLRNFVANCNFYKINASSSGKIMRDGDDVTNVPLSDFVDMERNEQYDDVRFIIPSLKINSLARQYPTCTVLQYKHKVNGCSPNDDDNGDDAFRRWQLSKAIELDGDSVNTGPELMLSNVSI